MKNLYFPILFLTILTLGACSSGKKLLEQGNYDLAVVKAVKRLQQKPGYAKAEKVLKEAYPLAVSEYMRDIEFLDKGNNALKFEQMARKYLQVNDLNNIIRRYPRYASLVTLVDVSEELVYSKKKAAQALYNNGKQLLALNTKQQARAAYNDFIKANEFDPGTVSHTELVTAFEAGVVNVIFDFTNKKRFFRDFNTEMVFNDLRNEFKNNKMTFLRVIDPGDRNYTADEIIRVELDEAIISGVNFSESKTVLKKENVFIGEAKGDSGKMVKLYGTVEATYVQYEKTVSSSARLMIQRMDARTNEIRRREVYPNTFVWVQNWSTYKGDKRALSEEQLGFCDRREPPIPAPQWLFQQATGPLVAQSIRFLSREYSYLK